MPKKQTIKSDFGVSVLEIIERTNLPASVYPAFNKLRLEAFQVAQEVFDNRAASLDVDHPCYEELVYGVLSLSSEVYKRARRFAALMTPLRKEPLTGEDLNRAIDICIDTINYLSWGYAMLVMASKYEGNANADDSPDYLGLRPVTIQAERSPIISHPLNDAESGGAE